MSCRGQRSLSRVLITFCDWGGSSQGMRNFLFAHGTQLQSELESQGSQLVVEVKRNHHPEIRACYRNGLHIEAFLKENARRTLADTGALRWRPPRLRIGAQLRTRQQRRADEFRMTRDGSLTHNPVEERAVLVRRVVNSDYARGRELNRMELGIEPDLPDGGYRLATLMQERGRLRHDPYDWPVWKVWGPSGKVVSLANASADEIEERLWWMCNTVGNRSTKWGHNVDRHSSRRPSIQGAWSPATAALLREATFEITEGKL